MRVKQDCAQGASLRLDLGLSAEAEATQDGNRRAPALQGVLEQERADGRWQKKKPAMDERAEGDPGKGDGGGVGFDRALDVPLPVQLAEPLADCLGSCRSVVSNIALRFPCDPRVDLRGRMASNAFSSGGQHGYVFARNMPRAVAVPPQLHPCP